MRQPGVVHIMHREYLGDMNPTTAFTNTSFPLNPGMDQTFPWLSQIASSYSEYYFKSLTFHFRSMSSSSVLAASGSNTALGTVMLSTEYNAVLPPFTTKNQMENHQYAASIKPSQNISHRIQCRNSHTPLNKLFIRNRKNEADTDLRLYDLGNFQIATQGMQQNPSIDADANYSIGELWVSYDVCFMKPKISDNPTTRTDVFHIPLGTSMTHLLPFGPNTPLNIILPIDGSTGFVQLRQGNLISFDPHIDTGYFLITWHLHETTASAHIVGNPTLATYENLKIVKFYTQFTEDRFIEEPEGVVDYPHRMVQVLVKITGPSVNEQQRPSLAWQFTTSWNTTTAEASVSVTEITKSLGDKFLLSPV